MKLNHLALKLIFVLGISIQSFAAAPRQMNIIHACTPQEKWVATGAKVPQWFLKAMDFKKDDFENALTPINSAYQKPANAAAYDFLLGRAYYQLGLPELAFRYFQNELKHQEEVAKTFRTASVECLYRLQIEHPTFKINEETVPVLVSLWKEAPQVYRDYFFLLLFQSQLPLKDFPREIVPETMNQTLPALVASLLKSKNGVIDEQVVHQLKLVLTPEREAAAGVRYRPYFDLGRLTLARALLVLHHDQEAFEVAKQIAKKYPAFPENIELLAWIDLSLKKENASNAQAFTLRTPALKNYFAPQTSLIPTLIFLEHCQYEEAKTQLDTFRLKYRADHEYLAKTTSDGYSDLLATLKADSKAIVPPRIMAEWLKSPVVTSLMKANNDLLDEKEKLSKWKLAYDRMLRSKNFLPQTLKKLEADLSWLEKTEPVLEAKNVQSIRAALQEKTQFLKSELDHASQDAAFMEVDILVALSSKISKSALASSETKTSNEVLDDPKSKKMPTWDWGKQVASHLETDELWADEMGHFKVNLKDQCKPKHP